MGCYEVSVRLYDTDAAGVIYFSSLCRFAQDAYEQLLEDHNLSLYTVFTQRNYIFVVASMNADYILPIYLSDCLEVICQTDCLGDSSFTMSYTFNKKGDASCVARLNTTHVCLDQVMRKPITIPEELKSILTLHLKD